MNTVTLIPNALEPEHKERFDVPELLPWLVERFGSRFAPNTRIFHQVGVAQCDVTPETVDDIEHLAKLRGAFVVRIYPAGSRVLHGAAWLFGGFMFGPVISAGKWLYDKLTPEVPNIKTAARRAREGGGSPNNQLGKRSNVARPEERIPDGFGQFKSIPDLLSVPYTSFVNHVERETCYLCVGKGFYVTDLFRDGDSLIEQIQGASISVYEPGNAPTGGPGFHNPSLVIGDDIDDDVYNVYAVEAVNGQELFAFRDFTFYGSAIPEVDDANPQEPAEPGSAIPGFLQNGVRNLEVEYVGGAVGRIGVPFITDASEITDRVAIGDRLYFHWPTANLAVGGGPKPDLGTPIIAATPLDVDALTVTNVTIGASKVGLIVSIPVAQQAEWAKIPPYFATSGSPAGIGYFPNARVSVLEHVYVGPFFIDFQHPPGSTNFEVLCNFVAPEGIRLDDQVTAQKMDVEVQVILTPTDASGTPTGAAEAFQGTILGSDVGRGQRALTLRCKPVGFGTTTRCLVQARRITNSPRRQLQSGLVEIQEFGASGGPIRTNYPAGFNLKPGGLFSGTVTDEVRWTHCYSMSTPPQTSFGNVTTIHSRTVATPGALRVKNRELSCIASRKIRTWNGATFGGPVVFNDAAENVLFEIMKDAAIGNLPDANIDFVGIVAAFEAVRASVSTTFNQATQFAYTFDDADLSFEETMMAICQSAFVIPFRRLGNIISARPELAGDDSVLIFNHRNVLKDTLKISHTFGPPTEHDSVEVGFADPFDDTITKVIVPEDSPQRAPRQVGVIGLRLQRQAYWHAYRAYHKMLYQRQSVSLEATQEAQIVGVRQRILIGDQTRAGTQEGEILGGATTTVRTSQPVVLDPARTYTIYLQSPDGTVQGIAVVSVAGEFILTLASAPSPAVITDMGLGVRTLYQVIADDESTPRAYLVVSTQPSAQLRHDVTAVNYSHMYYLADGLTTWVQFFQGLDDLSPMQREFTLVGGSIGGGVWTGSFGDYFEVTGALPADVDMTTDDYSCFLRINATLPTDAGLIQSGNDTSTLFNITAGGFLVAGHDGVLAVSFDYNAHLGTEHTVALTYVAATERMALFVDGVLVDEATRAQSAMTGVYRYLGDYEGTCRELYKWSRALSDREIMEVHLRTRP